MVHPLRLVLATAASDDGDADRLARDLRDGGVEVIRTGSVDPAAVARTTIQEDADAVALPGGDIDADEVQRALADAGIADGVVLGPASTPILDRLHTALGRGSRTAS